MNIRNPVEHIEQGDSYGSDLELAYEVHVANDKLAGTYSNTCNQNYLNDLDTWQRRQDRRQRLRKQIEKIG